MSRVPTTAPIMLLFVLILTSLSPIVVTNTTEMSEVEQTEVEMPRDSENWPAEARSSAATAWLKETVDTDGDTGQWTSSDIADDGTVWVAFYSAAGRDLKVAHWNGWSWQVDDVYTFGDIGKYAEIDIDSNGNPRIASFDITNAVLRISRYDGNSWGTNTVAPGENTGDGNPYAGEGRIGFAIDDSDSEWFSFYTEHNGEYNLSFANWDSSDQSWAYGTIDNGLGESGDYDDYSDIGQFSSLQIGDNGRPRVAYTCALVNSISDPVTGTTISAWYTFSLRYAAFDGGGWGINDIHINETGRQYYPAWWLQLEIDSNGYYHFSYSPTGQSESDYGTVYYMTTEPVTRVGWSSPDSFYVYHMGQIFWEPVINYSTYSGDDGEGQQLFYVNPTLIGDTLDIYGYYYYYPEIIDSVKVIIND